MARKKKNKESFLNRLFGRGDTHDDDAFEEMDGDLTIEQEEYIEDDMFEENQNMPARADGGADDLQINLVDKGKILVAQAVVPGLDEGDITINLNREMLTIETNSNEHCIERDGDYLYEELSFGSFSRSILLPAEVEVEDAKAEVRDGVLTILMPKIDKASHKKLSVKKK